MTTTKPGSRSAAMLSRHLHSYLIALIVLVSCCLDRIDSWTPDVLTKSYITYGKWQPVFFPMHPCGRLRRIILRSIAFTPMRCVRRRLIRKWSCGLPLIQIFDIFFIEFLLSHMISSAMTSDSCIFSPTAVVPTYKIPSSIVFYDLARFVAFR